MENAFTLLNKFKSGTYNQRISNIYFSDEEQISYQRERYTHAIEQYIHHFGEEDIDIFSAPGRTEIGGNHTDHQNGMVLAASINLDAIAIVGQSTDSLIHIVSEGYNPITLSSEDIEANDGDIGNTIGLIKGVLAGIKNLGYRIGPFKAYITSDVLNGAGLSSSAAFEILIGTIISGMFNDMQISPITLAMVGQYAENVFFGKPCGLMDQMACSVGSLVHIDFQDPKSPSVNQVVFDIRSKGYHLCIVDTKGSHADLTPDYAAIPGEMKSVAACFEKNVLSQVPERDFYAALPELRNKVGDRAVLRAIHFYQENKRVQCEVNALNEVNFEHFLEVFRSSSNSSYKYLQNVYSGHDLTNQAIPIALALSERILGENGVARVHGGGFAGTIQVFVKSAFVQEYKKEIEKYMGEGTCHILNIRQHGGIKVV